MTFPSSPFPRCIWEAADRRVCATPFCLKHSIRISNGEAHTFDCECEFCGPAFAHARRDFPILHSEPLWRQTWIAVRWRPEEVYKASYGDESRDRGYWFPPIVCGEVFNISKTPVAYSRRLYTVDNCDDCVRALQAVELMVYGIAYELQQWPDDWGHRCFHRCDKYGDYMTACACGRLSVFCDDRWWYEADEMLNVRLYFPPGITATVTTSTGESTTVELASGTYEIALA